MTVNCSVTRDRGNKSPDKSSFRDAYLIKTTSPVKPNIFNGLKLADKKSFEILQETLTETRYVDDPNIIHTRLAASTSPRKLPKKSNAGLPLYMGIRGSNQLNKISSQIRDQDIGNNPTAAAAATTANFHHFAGHVPDEISNKDDWIEKIDKKTNKAYYYSPHRRKSRP